MNWLVASLITLILWGTYGVFANKAIEIHGWKMTMVFEAFVMAVIAGFVILFYGAADVSRITLKSSSYAVAMGFATVVGLVIQFYAMDGAPGKMPLIILVCGMYPVITVLISYFMGSRFATHQWLGVCLAFAGLVLINLPKR